jgi:hypothetical protein
VELAARGRRSRESPTRIYDSRSAEPRVGPECLAVTRGGRNRESRATHSAGTGLGVDCDCQLPGGDSLAQPDDL